MSGAGRSGAADVIEDLGWYVVDNLPTSLVEKIVELASMPGSGIDRLALVAGRNHGAVLDSVAALRAAGHHVTLLFLDAQTPSWSGATTPPGASTRWPPRPTGWSSRSRSSGRCSAGTCEAADLVIDTTDLNVHQLKERLVGVVRRRQLVAAAGRRRELRVQARPAARRRHRDGRALPAQPALGRAAAAADRPRPGRARLRARAGRDVGVPRPLRRPAAHRAARRTRPRAAATSRSPSAAPAAATARSPSPRSSPTASAPAAPPSAPPTATSPADARSILSR